MSKRLTVRVLPVILASCLVPFIGSAQTSYHLRPSAVVSVGASQIATDTSVQQIELDPALSSDDDSGNDATGAVSVNRSIAKKHGVAVGGPASVKTKSNPLLTQSFEGLNLFQQRYANNGNQFTVEPPDQGLCVGNGYVLESTNDVLRIFNTQGKALTGPIDLNTFYGYPAAINRTTLQYGPSITDPSCTYDAQTGRFFHLVLTLDRVGTTSALAGTNHLDLAVSNSSNPLGSWTIYHIDAANNGANGTPNHQCAGGYCFGDYPHIGFDAYGIYLTTNEFALFGSGFYGAQVYALSKRQLANGTAKSYVLFNTADYLDAQGLPGFTVWPATSGAGDYITDNGGTEQLLSSDAVFFDSGLSSHIRIWTLTNTSSLDTSAPSLKLSSGFVNSEAYGIPPYADQKTGPHPYGESHGYTAVTPMAANDSRMQQVYYANGKLWTALDTGLTWDGVNVFAGAAYFVIVPQGPGSGKIQTQGYIGVQGDNLTYPAAAATQSGRGVVAFTVVGPDYFPSAGYASLDAVAGAGSIQLAAGGAGPQDGFTQYPAEPYGRPRWGDYGAASVDGTSIWTASEYIGQTCTLQQYSADPTCGQTRAPLGNWSTRISQLALK